MSLFRKNGGPGSGRKLPPAKEKAILRAWIQLEKDPRVKGGMQKRIDQIDAEQRKRGGK